MPPLRMRGVEYSCRSSRDTAARLSRVRRRDRRTPERQKAGIDETNRGLPNCVFQLRQAACFRHVTRAAHACRAFDERGIAARPQQSIKLQVQGQAAPRRLRVRRSDGQAPERQTAGISTTSRLQAASQAHVVNLRQAASLFTCPTRRICRQPSRQACHDRASAAAGCAAAGAPIGQAATCGPRIGRRDGQAPVRQKADNITVSRPQAARAAPLSIYDRTPAF